MNKRLVGLGLGLLVVAVVLPISGPLAIGVTLKTGTLYTGGGPSSAIIGCYTSGVEGQLVADAEAGTAIIDGMTGQRVAVTWPLGYAGRRSWSEVEVVDRSGTVVARTGRVVNLPGGYWTDGSFLACGNVIPNY